MSTLVTKVDVTWLVSRHLKRSAGLDYILTASNYYWYSLTALLYSKELKIELF